MMMLENSFAVFNNITPRLQWAEIDLPFPSSDICFKAASYNDLSNHSGYPVPKIKIKDAFLLLFSPMETADNDLMTLRNGNISALDMQMLIHGKILSRTHWIHCKADPYLELYIHAWNSTFCNPLAQLPTTSISSLVAPFKLAMRNWKLVWDEIKSTAGADEWNSLGFERTAETYYNAARSILRIFESRDGKFPPIPSNCAKGAHLKKIFNF